MIDRVENFLYSDGPFRLSFLAPLRQSTARFNPRLFDSRLKRVKALDTPSHGWHGTREETK
jgi:hypothetical protein